MGWVNLLTNLLRFGTSTMTLYVSGIIGVSFLTLTLQLTSGTNTTRKQLITDIFTNYDSRIPPNINTDGPVDVTVQVFISSIDTISETNMFHAVHLLLLSFRREFRKGCEAFGTGPFQSDIKSAQDFSLGMFLRQSWYDRRLNYTDAKLKMLELDVQLIQNVWVPDLYMPAEKKATLHEVTVPNKLMHVYPDGKIQYSMRVSAVLKCNFDLRKFPLDSQHCVVEMESYGYTQETLSFKWDEKPIQIKDKMKIPQFTLLGIVPSQCDKLYYGVPYTCVKMDLSMQRDKGYYITQVYLPSFLIVFLSWVSFWLDIDAVPARISLGLLTVLTMTTQSAGARANLPKVSYVKAIDVWMAVCLVFVFLALVQFAYVNVLSRVEKRRKTSNIGKVAIGVMAKRAQDNEQKEQKKLVNNDGEDDTGGVPDEKPRVKPSFGKVSFGMMAKRVQETEQKKQPENGVDKNVDEELGEGNVERRWRFPFDLSKKKFNLTTIMSRDREKARNVDRASRLLFPGVFFMFNVIYWCTYVFWEPAIDH